MKNLSRPFLAFLSSALLLLAPVFAQSQTLFSDNFDTDTSAAWRVLNGSSDGVPDYTSQFAFDYSTNRYVANGVTNFIPPAPNSGGTTRGLKLTVNKDDVAATAAVSVFPIGRTFTNNYALKFDMWLNYNGPAFGGFGSTEYGSFGLNHTGSNVIWFGAAAPVSDGVWFAVTGEGGSTLDYRAFVGDGATPAVEHRDVTAGFLDRDGNGVTEFETNPTNPSPLHWLFPAPLFETRGAPGKRWVQVEVRQVGGVITWIIDGYVIAEHANTLGPPEGTIMLGLIDSFSSIANPKEDNFVIYDNVRVVDLSTGAPPVEVQLVVDDATAAEPGSDTASFTISRNGDTNSSLSVTYRILGSASNGVDYVTLTNTVIIPAGADRITVVVTPINDAIGEPTETIELILGPATNYLMRTQLRAVAELLDDNDVTLVNISLIDAHSYERQVEDIGRFNVVRFGDISGDLTVNLLVSGSAGNGVDYQLVPNSVVIPAGSTNVEVVITPIDDSQDETNETIVLQIQVGTGYTTGTVTRAQMEIRDDDFGPETILFQDNFDGGTSQWKVVFGAANNIFDARTNVAFDYSSVGIPPAPGSTNTIGLFAAVNKDDTNATGAAAVNFYPEGQSFSGNFALRFNMYLNYGTEGGTTEHAVFGINHSGNLTNRHNSAGGDGIWFAVNTDSSANREFATYFGNTNAAPTLVNNRSASTLASVFSAPPYRNAGGVSGGWADVEVSQTNGIVTWKINEVIIDQRTNTSSFTSGNIMLGMADQFNSIGSTNNYVVYDNVRVVGLGGTVITPGIPTIAGIRYDANNVIITVLSANAAPAQIGINAATDVMGPYNPVSPTSVVEVSPDRFEITLPRPPSNRFYRARLIP